MKNQHLNVGMMLDFQLHMATRNMITSGLLLKRAILHHINKDVRLKSMYFFEKTEYIIYKLCDYGT